MKRTPKICLISNPDSIHVRRWARHFSEREFDVSLLSFYQPESEPIPGVEVQFVHPRTPSVTAGGRSRAARSAQRFPGLLRLATAARYRRSRFYRLLERINPDVLHAHYVSDYGFLAALSKRHPLVVSAWGSDILVDPGLSPITRRVVRWVLGQADLVTYDAERVREVAEGQGASSGRMLRVVLGVDRGLLEALAAGAYPVVSDLPANHEWVGAEGGTVVPPGQAAPLADAIAAALTDPSSRESAAKHNQELVVQQGLWDANMARMEDAYRGLAGVGVNAGGATP